jgi:hypothetical protein
LQRTSVVMHVFASARGRKMLALDTGDLEGVLSVIANDRVNAGRLDDFTGCV